MKSTNQGAAFLQPATNVLLRNKLILLGEKRETLLRDKFRVFVSRISPPLRSLSSIFVRDLKGIKPGCSHNRKYETLMSSANEVNHTASTSTRRRYKV